MATLTYKAAINAKRNVNVTGDASGAFAGTVTLMIDNTANFQDVNKAIQAAVRRWDKDMGKNSKTSTVDTSGKITTE